MDDLRGGVLALEHYYELHTIAAREVFGARYAGTQKPLARPVALWTLERLQRMGASAHLLERIKRATWRASALDHPVQLRVVDYGVLEGGAPFIVTERPTGVRLRELIAADGPLDPGQVLAILERLVDALDEAHARDVFHGGLDTARVFIDAGERGALRVKLFGYGLGLERNDLLSLGQAVFDVEMVRHLPPESFDADASDLWEEEDAEATRRRRRTADVYGLGQLAYECLTGIHPYFNADRDVSDGVLAMLQEKPPSLSEHFGLDPALDALLRAALARDPDERPDTPRALVERMRAIVHGDGDEESEALLEAEAARPRVSWLTALGRLTPRALLDHLRQPLARVALVVIAVLALVNVYVLAELDAARAAAQPKTTYLYTPPAAPGEGVDLFFPLPEQAAGGEVTLHLVDEEGGVARVGALPFALREQAPGADLRFLLMGQGVPTTQIAVRVRGGEGRWMMVDTTRAVREGDLQAPMQTAAAPAL